MLSIHKRRALVSFPIFVMFVGICSGGAHRFRLSISTRKKRNSFSSSSLALAGDPGAMFMSVPLAAFLAGTSFVTDLLSHSSLVDGISQ